MLADFEKYWPALRSGAWLTIQITVAAMVVALVVGLVFALLQLNRRRWYVYWPVHLIVEMLRGTPLLLQIFYIYFVLPEAGVRLSPVVAGVTALGLNYGAYLSEVYRAGIAAVPRGQVEAALSLNYSQALTMRRIILPQAIRIVIPPMGNYFIALFKDTALLSTISVVELLFATQLIASSTFNYFGMYTIVMVLYFFICYPAALGVKVVEKRMSTKLEVR